MTRTAQPSGRIQELDAARGIAMLGVCVSHASFFVTGQWQSTAGSVLITLGLIATPTFLLMSGMVSAYLLSPRNPRLDYYRCRLLDRGLFILVVVHLLLAAVHATWQPLADSLWKSFYITDSVGLGLIVASTLAYKQRIRTLLSTGLALFMLSWLASTLLHPLGASERMVMRLLLGLNDASANDEGYIVPVIPYLGIFLVGFSCGKLLSTKAAQSTTLSPIAGLLLRIGLLSLIAGVLMKFLWLAFKPQVHGDWFQALFLLTEPRQKLPPGPSYILTFGGAGMLVAASLAAWSELKPFRVISRTFAVVGRASLATFVLQYLLLDFPSRALGLVNIDLWLVLVLPLILVVIWLVAWQWDRHRLNRLYTLGLCSHHADRPATCDRF